MIHTMEYYPALKRKKIPTRATTKMNLEDILLSEISQSLKDKYCMISLKCSRVVKFIEIGSRMKVEWLRGAVKGICSFRDIKFSTLNHKLKNG